MTVQDGLAAEMTRYERRLPELLASTNCGRWVVFKDGAVQSVHEGGYEAWRTGTRQFGFGASFVVSRVQQREPIRVRKWQPSATTSD